MVIKCENGHWYDATLHRVCPHCKRNSEKLNMRIEDDVVEEDKTVAFAQVDLSLGQELGSIIGSAHNDNSFGFTCEGDDKTISFGFFGMTELPPVVGWLVCMTGTEKGKDFRLHSGKNFVGRSTSMDVVLTDDKKISREKHCSVIYDYKGNHFFVSAENANLTYVNKQLTHTTVELNEGDIITIGDTELLFIPFCKGERVWKEE